MARDIRTLIADDHEWVLEYLCNQIEARNTFLKEEDQRWRYRILKPSCKSGAQLLALAQQFIELDSLDLVIADWKMPNGDGIDALQQIKEFNIARRGKNNLLQMILVTAMEMSDPEAKTVIDELGAFYLPKALNVTLLRGHLKEIEAKIDEWEKKRIKELGSSTLLKFGLAQTEEEALQQIRRESLNRQGTSMTHVAEALEIAQHWLGQQHAADQT